MVMVCPANLKLSIQLCGTTDFKHLKLDHKHPTLVRLSEGQLRGREGTGRICTLN